MDVKRCFKITKQKDTKTQNDTLSRVRAAEKLRSANKWSRGEAEEEAGVSPSTYDRSIWLLRYGDPDLLEAVSAGEIGVFTAFDRMHERLGNHYPNQKMLKSAEILCQTLKMAIFRKDGELQVAQALSGAREKLYLLTDCPDVVVRIKRIILLVALCGYKISSEGYISKPDGTPFGHLAHHASIECPDSRYHHRVKQKQIPNDGRYDLRIGNISFPDAPWAGNPPVYVCKRLGLIELFSRNSKEVTQADYDLEMFRFLEAANLHTSTRGRHRLRVTIDDEHDPYLYELIMACKLYGEMPRDNAHAAGLIDRFRADYPCVQIDHLNADSLDCRIANLMVMTGAQNGRKQAIQRKLQSRSDLYADLSRYDNTHVKLEAGRIADGAKTPEKAGIYTVDELLEELRAFLNKHTKEESHGRR